MIWTTATGVATQIVTPVEPATDGPRLGILIAEHGLLGGLLHALQAWRTYPPHGPIALSNAHGAAIADPLEHPTER